MNTMNNRLRNEFHMPPPPPPPPPLAQRKISVYYNTGQA